MSPPSVLYYKVSDINFQKDVCIMWYRRSAYKEPSFTVGMFRYGLMYVPVVKSK